MLYNSSSSHDSWGKKIVSFLYLADLREAVTCGTLCCTLRLRIGLQRQHSEHETAPILAVQEMPSCLTGARREQLRLASTLQQPP